MEVDGARDDATTVSTATNTPIGCAMSETQQQVFSEVTEAWTKAGGPVQYLAARYSTLEEQQEFAAALRTRFPTVPTLTYHDTYPLPITVASGGCDPCAPLCLHPALFAFGDHASVKSLPELNVAVRLLEEVLLDGFLSQTEPLQVTVIGAPCLPDKAVSPLPIQSIGYIKGQARMCTLLGLLSCIMDSNVDVGTQLPRLSSTACAIHCHHTVYATKRDELFANFKASHRGAIRKPPPHPAVGGSLAEAQQRG